MIKGLDYSWARPGGAAIKAAGYSFVCRYLSDDTTGKTLNSAEAKDLMENGLSIVLVWENVSNAALGGTAQGVADATKALAQANALGVPESVTIYFAVDFDSSPEQQAAIDEYLKGAGTIIGDARVGVYGSFYVCQRCQQNGSAAKFWQTLAWSGGQQFSGNQIYQDGESAFSGGADVDIEENADFGAWQSGSSVTPATIISPAQVKPIAYSQPAQATGPGGSYKVVNGDSLSAIGAKLGVDWKAIAAINGINSPYTIYAGETLQLPGSGDTPEPVSTSGRYVVKSGDTLSGIASEYGTTYQRLAQINGIADPDSISVGEVIVIPGASPSTTPSNKTYAVVKGDSLSSIGSKTGIAWTQIAALNGIASPYTIYPGELLKLN
jgi:LysM repeat protein